MAEEKKDLAKLVALISVLKGKTSEKTRETIRKIISLSYAYPFHNKQFTFDKDKNLEYNVDRLLIMLVDSIINDIEDYSSQVQVLVEDEEDNNIILAFIHRSINGEDLVYRLDKHMTRLKNALEAFIAIGFANFMSENDLYNAFIRNLANPFAWSPMLNAYKDSLYEATSIKARGYAFGSHIDNNIEKAIGLVLTQSLIETFNYGTQLKFKRQGATGWTTIRGSDYDCGQCDSWVGVRHSMYEIWSGWHPRCLCQFVPLYD